MRLMRLLYLLGFAIFLLPNPAIPPSKRPVAVIAHRGGMGEAPENTKAAIENAIKRRVDWAEVDVRYASDGTLILLHDNNLQRTTGEIGTVSEMPYQELRKFNIPTFREILELCRGKCNVYIHYKDGDARAIWQEIRDTKMTKQVMVYIPLKDVAYWRKIAPLLPLMVRLPEAFRAPEKIKEFARQYPISAIEGPTCNSYSKELIDAAHGCGLKVFLDCLGSAELPPFLKRLNDALDSPETYQQAIERGADGIQTDYPQRLLDYLKTHNPSAVK